MAAAATYFLNSTPVGVDATAWAALLVVSGVIFAVWDPRWGIAGVPVLFVLTMALFHFGLVWSLPILGREALVGGGDNSWAYSPAMGSAVALVAQGMLALGVGTVAIRPFARRIVWRPASAHETRQVAISGVAALVVGWVLFIGFLVERGGWNLLGQGYGAFFEATSGSNFGYASLLLGLGSALCVAAGGRHARAGWLSWIVFAAITLSLGARGSALYPLMAMLLARGRTRRISLRVALLATLVLGVLISAIRIGRNAGVGGIRDALRDANPLEALAEMGYSIRPVVDVWLWLDAGEKPLGGASIVILPLRWFESAAGIPHPDASLDPRFFNVLVENRLGPVGGSPIAESYYNGGLLYVWLVLGLIGLVLGLVDQYGTAPRLTGTAVVIMMPLFMLARNFFSALPAYWLLGVLLLLLGRFFAMRYTSEVER